MYTITIYFNSVDYPGKYMVRRWYNLTPEKVPLSVTHTLQDARKAIPSTFRCFSSDEEDCNGILETWI